LIIQGFHDKSGNLIVKETFKTVIIIFGYQYYPTPWLGLWFYDAAPYSCRPPELWQKNIKKLASSITKKPDSVRRSCQRLKFKTRYATLWLAFRD
jgi:hypothetical protein